MANINIINIESREGKSRLIGHEYGKELADKYLKKDISEINIIYFPDTYLDVSMSFVKGFTEELFTKISYQEYLKSFVLIGNKRLANRFNRAILI